MTGGVELMMSMRAMLAWRWAAAPLIRKRPLIVIGWHIPHHDRRFATRCQCNWNALPSPMPDPTLSAAPSAKLLKEIFRAKRERGKGATGLDRLDGFEDWDTREERGERGKEDTDIRCFRRCFLFYCWLLIVRYVYTYLVYWSLIRGGAGSGGEVRD